MTKWRVAALIAVATLVPALTMAVVLADLTEVSRQDLIDAISGQGWVLAAGLVILVGSIGAISWQAWRSQQRRDSATAAAIDVIADSNPEHRLTGDTALEHAVNHLADRHSSAEDRLTQRLDAAHQELRRERDALLAVMTGLDIPVIAMDDAGRVLLANPVARRRRARLAAGRSIFSVFDAEDFMPLLDRALRGERQEAVVENRQIRLVRISGADEPAMVLLLGDAQTHDPDDMVGPVVGLSVDLARPARRAPSRQDWLATPLTDIVFTVLDCETTGLHVAAGDRLISVGAVRVDGGLVRADDTFDELIDPGIRIPASSTEFHGITDDHVAGAPAAPAVLADFAQYAADSVLVGHHLAFDLGFLNGPAVDAGVTLEDASLDTMLLSAVLDSDPDARHGLDAVCARFGVEVLGRHTALGDALATAEVLVRMFPALAQRGIMTLGDARAAMRSTELAQRIAGAAD